MYLIYWHQLTYNNYSDVEIDFIKYISVIILDSSVYITQSVSSIEGTKINFYNDLVNITSGQLRNLGSMQRAKLFGIAKNTLTDWEIQFSGIKQTLLLYALVYSFLNLTTEGDEVYTRVGKNVHTEEAK